MTDYASHYKGHVNTSGHPSFLLNDWQRLDRFLILGSEGGRYRVGEAELTRQNATAVERLINLDGPGVVQRTVEMSDSGRTIKNNTCIFVLALCARLGNEKTRRAAYAGVQKICRTGTHLFTFVRACQTIKKGWSRGLRRAITDWYTTKKSDRLALQLVKYQSRDGWSHTDLLKLSHPKAKHVDQQAAIRWAVDGLEGLGISKEITLANGSKFSRETLPQEALPKIIQAFEQAKSATSAEICRLIRENDLPREAVPTQHLNDVDVWEALLEKMPITATIRNLNKMTSVGLTERADAQKTIVSRLTNAEQLKKGRVHPISLLIALKTYSQGRGFRGGLTWIPNKQIVDALDSAFYKAFSFVEPTGKRHLLALDVSGSMMGALVSGTPGLTAREAAAAIAMVIARTEPSYEIVAFSGDMVPLDIGPTLRLEEVLRRTDNLPFSYTDCSQPMIWAGARKKDFDVFVVVTDNEHNARTITPDDALRRYRKAVNPKAKLAVLATSATDFSIADPNDSGMIDLVGFDPAVPIVLSDFVTGGQSVSSTSEED